MSEVFSVLLHNRQRYEQGKEGLWFSLPTTTEKLQAALREIGISTDNPQDFFLYGYRSPQKRPIKLPRDMVLSAGMDELNFLAARLEKLDAAELTELNAALTSPQSDFHNIGQIIDYPENVDFYVHLPDVTSTGQLGDYYLNRSGMVDMPEEWKAGILLPRFGLHIANTEHGVFTDYGYLVKSGDEWQRVHEGQPVPEQYRVMAYPAPEILREESKVQPEAAAPTKAPQPVTPILLNGQNSAERMKEITDRLETGIQELFESERYKAYLTTMSKFHSYSFNNTLLIAMQGGQLVAGYNKWRDDFHRNVKKGEKAIKILAPAPFKAKKEVQKLDAQGRPVMGKDGKPVTEVQEIQVPAFKIVSVFDVSQTEGEPLPSIGVEELTGSVERYGEFFKALEQTSPVPIGFEDIPGGSHGYYHLTEKRIAIQEGMSELQTLKTAIHEIAHSKLHAIDPEAPAIEQADRPDSRTREVQAESVAYAVCQHYGLDTSDYSFGYVAGWSSGKDLKELKASLETIRATAHELITTIDGHLAQLQKERQAQQEQPQAAPLEQAAEQPDPDSVFSKLPPEQQQEMTASVKAMLQTLIDADLKSTGEVSQGTKEAAQVQGFTIAGDGTLEQAKAPQEAAYRLESGDYLYIQTSETGYDYTLYGPDYKELDGGQLDNPGLSLVEAGKEILAIHERPAGTMEPLTGDGLDDFLEATEQANAIPQPQAWNGIDGLLNGKPFMPEASPADRAAALIELAEKNAPRLGSEERQLIVAYAEAVGDTDKVIGLINRLCEQGYELQKGQMDSFVKSEIGSEIAVANAQRQIAQNPAAEPVVTILWSESPHLKDGQQMPLHEAEAVFKELDSARRHEREQPGYTGHWYDKTKFRIDFTMQGQPDSYEGRQDFGDGDGALIDHIQAYHEYYAKDENWKNFVLHNEGAEAWEKDKAERETLLSEFVPYMRLHCNLSEQEHTAADMLENGEALTPEQTAYFHAVLAHVDACREKLNAGDYHLPDPPQLSDFDKELQDYKAHVESEIAQEAEAAGMTVEEYAANGYEPQEPPADVQEQPEEAPPADTAPEQASVRYYTINEGAARRANDANSYRDYAAGSATAEYRQMVDQAAAIAQRQKERVDPMYHEKIDALLDTYARKLAENLNDHYAIEARVPSILVAGGSNFPVRKKEKQNAARDRNMQEWQDVQGILDKIRSTGMGGISMDDPQAAAKLEAKLVKLESAQETMKAVNAYFRKNKTLEGCPSLTPEQITKLQQEMAQSWHLDKSRPYPAYMLSNNNAEIRRIRGRIEQVRQHEDTNFAGWEFDGGRVEANKADNRLQVFFDGKPDEAARDELKANGFRWAPSVGAWQRQLNKNAYYAAGYISCIQPISGEKPIDVQRSAQQQESTVPDAHLTGERVSTPRGSFHVVDMTREQMEAAGYGYHHSTDDGKYLIMGNGTQAFAIAAEQREQENYMRTAELSTEQNYNMIDGQINNTPSVDELEEKAKRGEVISLSALAAAVKAEDGRTPQRDPDGKKPSIRAQLKADRAQSCKPQQREKEQEAKRSIRQALEME